ncbi:MAG: hypothetical protein ACYSR9_01555, partial [Planctomycetota bacterium]
MGRLSPAAAGLSPLGRLSRLSPLGRLCRLGPLVSDPISGFEPYGSLGPVLIQDSGCRIQDTGFRIQDS